MATGPDEQTAASGRASDHVGQVRALLELQLACGLTELASIRADSSPAGVDAVGSRLADLDQSPSRPPLSPLLCTSLAAVGRFTLTVREGPQVERERFESLSEALGRLSSRVEELRREGDLPTVKMLREFGPEQRVRARLEIAAGRRLRRREAGVDVMGDGSVVPYRGGTFKRHLDPPEGVGYEQALLEALGE